MLRCEFSLYYFSKWKKWEAEVCVLEGVSYEVRSTRDETGWAVRFFSLLFFLNEKMSYGSLRTWNVSSGGREVPQFPNYDESALPHNSFLTCFYPSKVKIWKWINEQSVWFASKGSIEEGKPYEKSEDFVWTYRGFPHYIGVWGGHRYPPKEADMKRFCNQL